MGLPPIIGNSPALKRAVGLMERFAPTCLPILLIGPTGTGKDLFARHIHERSGRSGSLVDVNCGALPHEMMESLLFGHRRGAFTGAVESVAGHIERSHKGTLFLDEVLHLSKSDQVKLLRVVEDGEIQRLGDSRKRVIDLRIVTAAQEDAGIRLVNAGFRRDLFQRIAGVVISLPSLADRQCDIVQLARHFGAQQSQRLESEAEKVLRGYPWPGNVRELRLTIQRAGCLVENGSLPASAIAEAIELGATGLIYSSTARKLVECLSANQWDVRAAARHFGIHRSALYERLRKEGISLRALRMKPFAE